MREASLELDAELVTKARAGDRAAFEKIVEQLWGPVYVFIRGRISDDERARDLAQDTFLRAIDKLDTLRSGQSMLSWIFTIASHRVIDTYRRQGAQPKMRAYDSEFDPAGDGGGHNSEGLTGRTPRGHAFPQPTPEEGIERAEDAEQLQGALSQLHDRYRAVLILRYWSGLTPAQIARLLAEPEGTIRNRIFRAHKQLRQLLESDESK